MADSQVAISIPEGLIKDLVHAAVVRELGGQRELIEGVVTAALQAKEKDYPYQTLFMKKTQEMIRKVAAEATEEWITESKEKIKAAFQKHLQSKDGAAVKKLVEGMVDGVSKYNVSVKFNFSGND